MSALWDSPWVLVLNSDKSQTWDPNGFVGPAQAVNRTAAPTVNNLSATFMVLPLGIWVSHHFQAMTAVELIIFFMYLVSRAYILD